MKHIVGTALLALPFALGGCKTVGEAVDLAEDAYDLAKGIVTGEEDEATFTIEDGADVAELVEGLSTELLSDRVDAPGPAVL